MRAPFVIPVLASILILGLIGTSNAFAQTTVFINEIHYDNSGADVGEAVEIAGPAGTDLTGWSVVLYNGASGVSYDTINLSGTLPDSCSGLGVVVHNPTSSIQNGAPDGIALVDDLATVVQFLSYEGSFTATNGPANGLTSTDIGVSESSSTSIGYSLQLSGAGTTYEDFTWAAAQPNTFRNCNTGQSFIGGSMTFVTDTTIFSDMIIGSGETWTVNPGVTLTIDMDVTITINSGGTITNLNGGIITILTDGTINMFNSGTFTNSGTINTDPDTIDSITDGIIAVFGGTFTNSGTINNSGNISFFGGTFTNDSGGIIDNDGTIINNSGTITNNSGGTIDNSGTITNNNDILSQGIINNDGGNIENNGFIEIRGTGTFNNNFNGNLNNNNGGGIENNGNLNNIFGAIITNDAGGLIRNNNIIDIMIGSNLNNDGEIDNNVTINNSGTINNTGNINNNCEAFFNNLGNFIGNPVRNNVPPSSGGWIISVNCTLGLSATSAGDVLVRQNSVLTIPAGLTLDIDFTQFNLTVESGSGVLIESGGKIT